MIVNSNFKAEDFVICLLVLILRPNKILSLLVRHKDRMAVVHESHSSYAFASCTLPEQHLF